MWREWLENTALSAVDGAMARIPRPRPDERLIREARVVAHRGSAEPARGLFENTIPAFENALASGTWGLEFDIRFTRDGEPVVLHDASAERVFGDACVVHELTLRELKARRPEIPTLEELVARFRTRAHLMIEIKKPRAPHSARELEALRFQLKDLEPERDFHFLGLEPEVLRPLAFVPRSALVLVGQLNCRAMSRAALELGIGGYAGPYPLLTGAMIEAHHLAGQKVGTGFIHSRQVLRRELGRGVDWIFTNHAAQVADLLKRELVP